MINNLLSGIGIGLKAQHYEDILQRQPRLDWLEVHPENYMGDGGLPHKYLSAIAAHYPLSMHGVGLSLGSADGIDNEHLQALKRVVDRYQPAQVSEHLAWSHWNKTYLNDLLPLPYSREAISVVVSNIHKVQDTLQRNILIENPSAYLGFTQNEMSETDFLREIVTQTECGLLLDVNNVYVSAYNQQYSATDYIDHYPLHAVGEIHLAGHAQNIIEQNTTDSKIDSKVVLIDDHGSPVVDEVWNLFEHTLKQLTHYVPILIEWDTNIPTLDTLLNETNTAREFTEQFLPQAPPSQVSA